MATPTITSTSSQPPFIGTTTTDIPIITSTSSQPPFRGITAMDMPVSADLVRADPHSMRELENEVSFTEDRVSDLEDRISVLEEAVERISSQLEKSKLIDLPKIMLQFCRNALSSTDPAMQIAVSRLMDVIHTTFPGEILH